MIWARAHRDLLKQPKAKASSNNSSDNESNEEMDHVHMRDKFADNYNADEKVPCKQDVIDPDDLDVDEMIEMWDKKGYLSESDNSDDDPERANDGVPSAKEKLAAWCNKNSIRLTAMDELLGILRSADAKELRQLPKTARALMKTKRTVETQVKSGMDYVNLGVEKSIMINFQKYPESVRSQITTIPLSLNVDGMPLFNSSKLSMWPVLCSIQLEPVTVFPLSITCGNKPSDLAFLEDNIAELKNVIANGLVIDSCHYNIEIKCIMCDAPAKALVKAVKQFSGYYGCDRCEQTGQWMGKITYPEIRNLPLRTDDSFRRQRQEEHHKGVTPMLQLPIDMIKQFPIDYMHQVCLGVMRRLMMTWFRGPLRPGYRLPNEQRERVDGKLIGLRSAIPSEFARKPRSVTELEHWKATEYRQFLLYTGHHALQDVLDQKYYDHFLALSVACTIMISPQLVQEFLDLARQLVEYFVDAARVLYGDGFLVYNVHSLLHLPDDAQYHGCLDNCSGFQFENLGSPRRQFFPLYND